MCEMGPIVGCPGGCAVRLPMYDPELTRHVQKEHPLELKEWLQRISLVGKTEDMSGHDPGGGRTIIVTRSAT